MRISGLAAATGVPVATIKYYLREGLLPPGEASSATQATYDADHVARLRLIRALVDVAGLSIAAVRDVLAALGADDVFDALGRTQEQLPPRVGEDVDTTAALDLVHTLGWSTAPGSAPLRQLAVALDAAAAVDMAITPQQLEIYGRAAYEVAECDVAGVPTTSVADATRYAVLGTVLYEPVLLALRRLAHQQVSAQRFGAPRPPAHRSRSRRTPVSPPASSR